jgi:Cu(I)/Ag(I) efflux system membrane fusion protein
MTMRRAVGLLVSLAVVASLVGAAVVAWRYWPQRPAEAPLPAAQAPAYEQAGLLTEPVSYRELTREVRTVGKLDYNERQVAYITARIAGRVDRVYADFTGIQVKKNDHLVDIYSPELVVAQGELVRAVEAARTARERPGAFEAGFAVTTLESARTKLRLLGLLPEQLDEIEKSGKASTHLTIYAPIGGTVIEKNVRAGQYVKEGDMLYRIADLDPIWLYLDIYESDLGWVRFGQSVDVAVEAFPGEPFRGTVTFIDPFLDDRTRTVKARVNLKNPDRRLKPAMYASATVRVRLRPDGSAEPTGLEGKYLCPMHPDIVRDEPGRCPICEMALEKVPDTRSPAAPSREHAAHEHAGHDTDRRGVLSVPVSAVLDTGRRQVVYRQADGGAFELVDVQVGPRSDGQDSRGQPASYYPVLKGLNDGDRVVVRGGFLLDSQRQIEGMPSLLYPQGQSAANLHAGHGGAPAAPAAPGQHKH